MPATSQLDWLISMTAMIVLFWSRATRDLLRSFGWGIAALHRLNATTKLPFPRRPPHSVCWTRSSSRWRSTCPRLGSLMILWRGHLNHRPEATKISFFEGQQAALAVGQHGRDNIGIVDLTTSKGIAAAQFDELIPYRRTVLEDGKAPRECDGVCSSLRN